MSVIRQPGVLGQTTQRRVVGVSAALTAALVETVAVGLWFVLVSETRSASTALAGLGILFCGALLRAGVFGVTIRNLDDLLHPRRLGAPLLLCAGWIVWLLVAETVGGHAGIFVATILLVGILVSQFAFERRAFRLRRAADGSSTPFVPSLLLAIGAASLLVSAWLVEWTVATPPLSLEITTVVFRVEAVQLGLLCFGVFAFLAHQRRFVHLLES
ncbi:hypothetical protein [Natronorubrum daqingense]|uniref:Uncharacterized protein n=1 Tax=Natronorubrum daqingense TaxID=588898 RepID=A0A1N7DPE6_9EURY|nr:hypothetical protein [Natronorubrum daqingense]APX96093.1 hypothetical protein BB347_05365 [Natronorubrum daqingense]SIR77641.1 hypothetical protein SAMN05421809_2154 [Natronorubrum daqingense]